MSLLAAGPSCAFAAMDPWTFASTPDFLNIDIGDLNEYDGPVFNAPSGNTVNASWLNAIDALMAGLQASDPDFVAVAGDLVMARWFEDAFVDGVFGPRLGDPGYTQRNLATENARVVNASNFYYDAWKQHFTSRQLPWYAAIGDHELGDSNTWDDELARQTIETYRAQFADHFVAPLGAGVGLAAGSVLRGSPSGGPQAGTAYAVQHRNLLLVNIDPFTVEPDDFSVSVEVTGEQLAWLERTLAEADADPTVKHVIVQGHAPALQPVKARKSSELSIDGAEHSPFWQALQASSKLRMYLSGEVHDVTVSQDVEGGGAIQIAHGGIFGFSDVADISYLTAEVHEDAIDVELWILRYSATGPQLYQTGNPTTQLRADIEPHTRWRIGQLTINESSGATEYGNATGVFSSVTNLLPAQRLGTFRFNADGDPTGFRIDLAASDRDPQVTFTGFESVGARFLDTGALNFDRLPTSGWPDEVPNDPPDVTFDEDRYVGFSASAPQGAVIDPTAISLLYNRSGRGPNDGLLRVSGDGFVTFDEFELFVNDLGSNEDVRLELLLSAVPPSQSLEFRFCFKDDDPLSPAAVLRLDDVRLYGVVSAVPEPATWVIVTAAVALVLRRRSGQAAPPL
ncbi:MAG: hypothetical protein CMJ18_14825 [Phycisphaeraceae bacterium]|nr:hypothetical protein [Phycisphaeraceae bacterium]